MEAIALYLHGLLQVNKESIPLSRNGLIKSRKMCVCVCVGGGGSCHSSVHKRVVEYKHSSTHEWIAALKQDKLGNFLCISVLLNSSKAM